MQIQKLSTPSFGSQNYNNQQNPTNKTITISKNALIAGLTSLLTSCASDTFTLSTAPNGEPMLPITKIMPGSTSSERRDVISILNNQSPDVISDLANETCLVRHFDYTDGANGYYSRVTETLNINDVSFLHELAHAIDNYDNNGTTSKSFSSRAEYRRTVAQEMQNFANSGLSFRNINGTAIIVDNASEIFAECAAYIISDGEYDENAEIFEEYFPRTMALTKQYVQEARSLPQSRRMSFSVNAQNKADGTRIYSFYNGNGRKLSEETFDPSLWPYRYAPRTTTYDASGRKIKEVTVEFRNNTPYSRTTWSASQGTRNEPIMTEATRQAYGLIELLHNIENDQNKRN